MSLSQFFVRLAVFFGLGVIVVITLLMLVDLGMFKSRIESSVSDMTGRDFSIDGDLSLKLLPRPTLYVEQARMANAEWGSQRDMLIIGLASADIKLWSIVFGPAIVRNIRLADVDLLIETNTEGVSNLAFGNAEEEEAVDEEAQSPDNALPVILESAQVNNINLVIRAPDADDMNVNLEALEIGTNASDMLQVDGNGSVTGVSVAATAIVGPYEMLRNREAVDYTASGNIGDLTFEVTGNTDDLETYQGAMLTANVAVPAMENLLAEFDIDSPLSGPLTIETIFQYQENSVDMDMTASLMDVDTTIDATLSDDILAFEVALNTLESLSSAAGYTGLSQQPVTVDGSLILGSENIEISAVNIRTGSAVLVINGMLSSNDDPTKLTLQLSGDALNEIRDDLPPIAFAFNTDVSLSSQQILLDPLALTLGDSDLGGNVSFDFSDELRTNATLQSSLFDLSPFMAPEIADNQSEGSTNVSQDSGESDSDESPYVFTDERLPFESLRNADVEAELTIERFVINQIVLDNVQVIGTLKEGSLNFEESFDTGDGGNFQSQVALILTETTAELQVDGNVTGLKVNLFSGEDATLDMIPPMNLEVNLGGQGESQRAIASSLNGSLRLTQGEGRIINSMIGRVSGDFLAELFDSLNPLSEQEEFTDFDCSLVAIDFNDGMGEINGLLFQSEKLTVVGGGDLDLNTERLNIEFNTKPREGFGLSADMFVTPFVKVTGTLKEPGIGLDSRGVLLSGGAAFLTGGLSFLFQGLSDRATASADQCVEILQ